ncbi:hypothetical protein [Methylobacter tundripaludum]|uniref:hypothetical protein n=1 Tax=Methylobacter tundripaludum TaxID=173365 RepID=UPI0012379456|nr:hypothetical protein [Methylobacter tundripaludum]
MGSSSFPSREAATTWIQEVEQRREQLPRASSSGFPSWWSLGTRVFLNLMAVSPCSETMSPDVWKLLPTLS